MASPSNVASDDESFSALHWAAYRGEEAQVRSLLAGSGSALSSVLEEHSNAAMVTPLLWACAGGHTRVVNLLLAAGAKANHKDAFGQTALMHAVQNSHLLVVRVLDLAGADLHCRDKDGHSLLHWSVFRDDVKITRYLLHRGLSPNDVDCNLATALHWAVIRGLPFMIPVLLEHGAETSLRDKDGLTPKELAEKNGHLRCVLELQNAHPPLNAAEKEARRQKLWYMGFLVPSCIFGLSNWLEHPTWGAVVILILALGAVQTGWLQKNILGAVRKDRKNPVFSNLMTLKRVVFGAGFLLD